MIVTVMPIPYTSSRGGLDLLYGVSTASELEASIATADSQSAQIQPSVLMAVQAFRRILHGIEGIEGILGDQVSGGLVLSVIVNNPPRERRRKIYDGEWKLMQQYPEVGFDFRLIDRRGRPLSDVISIEDSDFYLHT